MLKSISRISINDALITLIIVIGAVLRFYRLNDIPFTHDEFSAIIRTQFGSFGELIEKGVMIDGHPAGVQVFLYFMVKSFGISEALLKTPFILFGLLSIWLVYLIGKDWFNATVGLVAASFVSFLQYPVMYSQIARPYASGLCFAMLLVFFWTKVIFHPRRKYYLNMAGFILSAALCAYNHHFSMLFAAMVGLTGLFYCPKERLRPYLAAGILVIILYIPHLTILMHQIGIGGIEGWLSKPRYDFLFYYIQYIFHFSVYVYLLVIVLISLSLYWYQDDPPVKKKFILISLIWFLLPYLIGFFYSKYRSSVLQYSVLIFSFPFLLFVLFGLFKTSRPLHKVILAGLIAVVVIPTLIYGRQHYKLFYKDAYREIVWESKQMVDSLGVGRCMVILDARREINPYYLKKLDCTWLPFTYFDDVWKKGSYLACLDSSNADFLALGCLTSTNQQSYAMILEKYPYLVQHKVYCGGDFYLFARNEPVKPLHEYFYTAINTFEPSSPEWGWIDEKRCIDSLAIDGKKSFANSTGLVYSPTYTYPLRDLINSENDIIDISVDLRIPLVFPGAWLVTTITSGNEIIKWYSVAVNDYIEPGQTGRVFQSIRISDVELRHHRLKLTTFVWDPMKSPYIMDNFKVSVRKGNPVIYGLYRNLGH